MNRLREWWWPAYLLIFPYFFLPGAPRTLDEYHQAKTALTCFFLLGGMLIELRSNPESNLKDIGKLPGFFAKHPMVVLMLLFGIVALFSALLAPTPGFALVGGEDFSDGALNTFALTLVATLVYLGVLRDPRLTSRLIGCLLAGGVLMAALGMGEIITNRSVFFPSSNPEKLPLVMFGAKGMYAGYILLVLGVALGLYLLRSNLVALGAAGFLAFSLGLTTNRSVLIGLGVVLLWGFIRAPRSGLLATVVVGVCVGAGWFSLLAINQESQRSVASTETLNVRGYLWKAALTGIGQRPLEGWGAGQQAVKYFSWLSEQEVKEYANAEFGFEVVAVGESLIFVKTPDGVTPVKLWGMKAHNQLLDTALLHGVPAALLLLLIWVLSIVRGMWRNPLAFGLIAYAVYLMFWFMAPVAEAPVWMLLGATAAVAHHRTTRAFGSAPRHH